MTKEELEKKAEESYWNSDASGSMSSKNCYVVGYVAGAKAMQEENEQLKQKLEKAKITLNILENTEDNIEEVFCLEKLKELLGDTNDKI